MNTFFGVGYFVFPSITYYGLNVESCATSRQPWGKMCRRVLQVDDRWSTLVAFNWTGGSLLPAVFQCPKQLALRSCSRWRYLGSCWRSKRRSWRSWSGRQARGEKSCCKNTPSFSLNWLPSLARRKRPAQQNLRKRKGKKACGKEKRVSGSLVAIRPCFFIFIDELLLAIHFEMGFGQGPWQVCVLRSPLVKKVDDSFHHSSLSLTPCKMPPLWHVLSTSVTPVLWGELLLCFWTCRSLTLDDTSTGRNGAERAESPGQRALELKEKLEEELLQLGEENYDGIRKKKEQHATEVEINIPSWRWHIWLLAAYPLQIQCCGISSLGRSRGFSVDWPLEWWPPEGDILQPLLLYRLFFRCFSCHGLFGRKVNHESFLKNKKSTVTILRAMAWTSDKVANLPMGLVVLL